MPRSYRRRRRRRRPSTTNGRTRGASGETQSIAQSVRLPFFSSLFHSSSSSYLTSVSLSLSLCLCIEMCICLYLPLLSLAVQLDNCGTPRPLSTSPARFGNRRRGTRKKKERKVERRPRHAADVRTLIGFLRPFEAESEAISLEADG